MAMDLGELGFKISVDTSDLDRGLSEAGRKVRDFDKTVESTGRKKIKPTVDTGDVGKAKKALSDVEDAADKLASKKIKLPTPEGLEQAKRAEEALRQVDAAAKALEGRKVSLPLDSAGLRNAKSDIDSAAEATSLFEGRLGGAIGAAAKLAGAVAGVAGAGQLLSKTLSVGMEFQSQMNTMAAVSGATGEQLAAVGVKARALGTDAELTATSASDAAGAMTELAKGGFTVQQSMEAAKGTLQLAAAAQIGAADAATIQSQAIQAFGLSAADAANVADVLAGAANASSAEMAGVAQGMQATGTVAKQFGVSFEDTSTALAMFANAGIQGSDAGTMLKSALLALTDQGKPAQAAIRELGLQVYDAQGKFVGLPSLMGQLADASKRMTDEQYQAATATLFGSDAMRFAGIAAQQGSEGFDKLKDAVTRQGQAAEVAAAQTQGLPGVWERLQNTMEDGFLATFDAIDEQLIQLGNGAVDALGAIIPAVASMAGGAADALLVLGKGVGLLAEGFSALPEPVKMFAEALLAAKVAQMALNTEIGKAATAKIGEFFANAAGSLKTFGSSASEAYSLIREGNPEMSRAGAALELVAGKGGMASAAMGGLKSAAGSVIDFFGGPWAIGIAAAGALVGGLIEANSRAEQAQEEYAVSVRNAAEAQKEFNALMAGQSGEMSSEALAQASIMAQGFASEYLKAGESLDGFISLGYDLQDQWRAQGMDQREVTQRLTEVKESYGALKDVMDEMGVKQDDLGRIMAEGGQEWEQLQSKLRASGDSGVYAADQLQEAKTKLDDATEAARKLDPAVAQAAKAIDKLADSSSTGEDKLSALNSLLQSMGLAPKDAEQAMMDAAEAVDELAGKVNTLASADAGLGMAMFQDGKWNVTNENARILSSTLEGLGKELQNVGANGGDVQGAFDMMQPQLQQLREEFGMAGAEFDDLWAQITEKSGLAPEEITIGVNLLGASETAQQITEVWSQLHVLPPETHVSVTAETAQAVTGLEDIGIRTEQLEDGSFQVWAETDEAKTRLDELTMMMGAMGETTIEPTVLMNTDVLEGSAAHAEEILNALGELHPSPAADLIIDKLQNGVDISQGELDFLASQVANPTADLYKDQLVNGVQVSNQMLDQLDNNDANPNVQLRNAAKAAQDARNVKNEINSIPEQKTSNIFVRTWRYFFGGDGKADGGVAGLPGYATGGNIIPTFGPGASKVDGFLGVDDYGMPVARVNAGEFVTKRSATEKYLPVLRDLNEDDPKGALKTLLAILPGFATGGVASASEIKAALSGMDGTPYIMGGWSSAGTDCSGAVSMAVNTAVGLDPFDSRMSTVTEGSWLKAKGFEEGPGGPGDITVGWWDQGGGVNGHTAIQLQDGTYIESGGNTGGGLTIGGSAGPLEGRGFTNFMHLKGGDGADADGVDFFGEPIGDGGVTEGGNGSRYRSKFREVSLGAGGSGVAGAARRMGLSGGTIGSALGSNPLVSQAGAAARNAGFGQQFDQVMGTALGDMGELLLVTEDTVKAFNSLGKAREEEQNAILDIKEAQEALKEAREAASKSDGDAAEKIAEKEKALAKAREDGDPDKIAKAEKDLADAREQAPENAKKAADKVTDAEQKLQDAYGDHVAAVEKVRAAEAAYQSELLQAPFKQAQTIAEGVSSVVEAVGDVFGVLADRERERLKQGKEALSVLEAQISAQQTLQDAMESVTEAALNQASQQWKSNLAVEDAEWELMMHRKRSQIELAQATMLAVDTTDMQADAARHTATLEAQIANEKAKRDLAALERQIELDNAAANLEYSQRMAEIQTSKLTLVSAALADIQARLNDTELQNLEMKAQKAEGIGGVIGGLGGIAGGIAGIISAVGMAAVNPIGALAMGASAIPALLGGIGSVVKGVGAVKTADAASRALTKVQGGTSATGGSTMGASTLEGLSIREQQLKAEMEQQKLERQKANADQLAALRELVDNTSEQLEYAKRDESRASDLASLAEESTADMSSATAYFQLGGAGWDGGYATRRFTGVNDRGFAGIDQGRLASGSSMRVDGSDSTAAAVTLGRSSSPEVTAAAAAVVQASTTSAIRVQLGQLLGLAARITAAVEESDRQAGDVINGPVFTGEVRLESQPKTFDALASALAVKG